MCRGTLGRLPPPLHVFGDVLPTVSFMKDHPDTKSKSKSTAHCFCFVYNKQQEMDNDEQEVGGILTSKNVWIAVGVQALALVSLLVLVFVFADLKTPSAKRVFHFGPGTDGVPIDVFGMNINTGFRYGCLIAWLVVSEALSTYSYKLYKSWYRNYLLDPKSTSTGMSDCSALVLVNVFAVLSFIPKMFKVLLTILTAQIQFLIPSFLTRRLVGSCVDSRYLSDKQRRKKKKKKKNQ